MDKRSFSIVIHGGAGNRQLTPEQEKRTRASLLGILEQSRVILARGGTALDAVTQCVRLLEDDPLYNAGHGAVPNAAGDFELDACIMDGRSLNAGAVAAVRHIRNPVTLARLIMEQTAHVMLAGDNAEHFARDCGVALVSKSYFEQARSPAQPQDGGTHGTVGAVARDLHGNLAAATSTGGTQGKLQGRVGDSAVPGAGNYADNAGAAVSCTGHGEDFMRTALAAHISFLIEQKELIAKAAAEEAVAYLIRKVNGQGGFILVDHGGRIAAAQTSDYLQHGWIEKGGQSHTAMRSDIYQACRP